MRDIEAPKILLWFSDLGPEASGSLTPMQLRNAMPAFVSREMVDAVKGGADVYVEYVADDDAARGEDGDRLVGVQGVSVARRYPSATMHRQVADLLVEPTRQDLQSF
jgi:uncharacterized protein YqfA (UPF0365 family)